MEKLYYTDEVIKDIKELAKKLASVSDEHLINEKVCFYTNYKPHMERLRNVLSLIPEKPVDVLEIGSGIGTNCLMTKAFTGAEVVGVEPAPESYSLLQRCISSFQEANPHLPYKALACGGENIPYPDESFDFIYSFEVLEHVQDPEQVLKEIYRLLKSGACAYISTCNYDSFYEGHYKRFWNPFVSPEVNGRRYEKKGLSKQFLTELNFITKKKIRQWVSQIGYSTISFNPHPTGGGYNCLDCEISAVYPDNFAIPKGNHVEPTWWHRTIESPRISNLLARWDRDYKCYILLYK